MINKALEKLFKEPHEIAKKININLRLRPNQLTEDKYFKITRFFENKIK